MRQLEEILPLIIDKRGDAREQILLDLLLVQKVIPPFLFNFIPVFAFGTVGTEEIKIEYRVSPDYLALGTEENFLRIPLTPKTGQKIAEAFNCVLPTKRMVDQIYAAAGIKLQPKPYIPKTSFSPSRDSTKTYQIHNDLIENQLKNLHANATSLVAGHKKDIVITNKLAKNPGAVAIYGWHLGVGKPIQPLYLGHGNFYVDYSHGLRLVSNRCLVNGTEMDLEEILKHPKYGPILTGSEPLKITRYKTD